jgi:hypothetical protein
MRHTVLLCLLWSFTNTLHSQTGKAPRLFINHFSSEVSANTVINCRKINDLGVTIYISGEMKTYDAFKIELHRFGKKEDILMASRSFEPEGKEYQKNYGELDSLQLKVLTEETEFSSTDMELNTLLFNKGLYLNNVFCSIHERAAVDFYMIVKGYTKTGEKNQFGEELYTKGRELTPRSIVFQNWDFKGR